MSTFARLDPLTMLVRDTVELTTEQYASFSGNPKQAFIRPLVIDAQPVPNASQVIESAGYVVEPTRVRGTWTLRAKTQTELDGETQAAELAALRAMVQALSDDIALGVTAAPTTAAQAFVHIQELKRQMLRLNRAVRWVLKQQG